MLVQALLALVLAYLWVGILEAIDRFEQPAGPEYETAEPEFHTAPSLKRTLRIILLFPFSATINRSPLRSLVKVLLHAALVYAGAYGLSLLFDQTMLGIAVVGLVLWMIVFFYILTSATRLRCLSRRSPQFRQPRETARRSRRRPIPWRFLRPRCARGHRRRGRRSSPSAPRG